MFLAIVVYIDFKISLISLNRIYNEKLEEEESSINENKPRKLYLKDIKEIEKHI